MDCSWQLNQMLFSKNGLPFKNRPNLIKSPILVITLHIMTQVWLFPHVNQSQNSYPLTNSLPPPPLIDDTSRKSHSYEIISSFFLNFNSIRFYLLIMFYAIYANKFSLSSTSATKIYINLEIPEVAKIIDKCIFLKFIITRKSNNSIYLLSQKMPFT